MLQAVKEPGVTRSSAMIPRHSIPVVKCRW